jgi:acylphosphatase
MSDDTPRDDTATETQRIEARITGRVQGVGFRNFTQRTARRLGLEGWVRNEADGSVRLVAEGAKDDLQRLVDAVHDGPRAARVKSVSVSWADAAGDFETFRVRR